jgi:hypothetical protein
MRGATRKAYNDGGARVNDVSVEFASAVETRKSRHESRFWRRWRARNSIHLCNTIAPFCYGECGRRLRFAES